MRRLLLLSLLIAAPTWAQQTYDAFVLSQGAFGAQNSSVIEIEGGLDPVASPLATGRIYTQGAEVIQARLYLTAGDAFSGTSRVDVLDVETGQTVGQVTENLLNPRYLAQVGAVKAYVTNQDYSGGSSFVTPIDLTTNTAGEPIEVEGTPEGIAWVGGYAFVALGAFGGRDSLAVLDPRDDTLVGYVDLGCAARFVVSTYSYAWAACTDTDEAVSVDPTTLEVVRRVAIGEDIGDPNGIGQDAAAARTIIATRTTGAVYEGDAVLISTASGVVLLNGETGEVIQTVAIDGTDTRPITALGMVPGGGPLYLGRPDPDSPFGAVGAVTVHDFEGALLGEFEAGVFPSYVAINPVLGTAAEDARAASGLGLALAGSHPVRQRTALALTLDRAADVTVDLFDVLGRPVARLAEGARGAGEHHVAVDASGLAAGVYLVRATADGRAATLPLTVTR